jgi:hypothetical protein
LGGLGILTLGRFSLVICNLYRRSGEAGVILLVLFLIGTLEGETGLGCWENRMGWQGGELNLQKISSFGEVNV